MKLKRPLPKAAVPAGIAVAGLLVGLLGWMLLVSPQKHKATSLNAQATTVQQQVAQNLAADAAAKNAAATPKIDVADLYKITQAMPSAPDVPDVLIQLTQVTKAAGVTVEQLEPSTPTPDGQMPISLTVSGDFYTVTDLLYRLRNLVTVHRGALEATGRLYTIDSVSLSPATDGHAVTASLNLSTYSYVPVAAAPAPALPSPTDTTTTDTTSSDGSSSASSEGGS